MTDDLSFPFNGYIPPAIPEGDHYEVVGVRAEQAPFRGRLKCYLWFKLMTPGEWVGKEFCMNCTVKRNGKWAVSSKYWKAWVLAAGRRPNRADRMSTNVFKGKVFRARFHTVVETADQDPRTPEQQYSVIAELLEVMTGK
jgi:hypothetical protein